MPKVFAVGPRDTQFHEAQAAWVDKELDRCVGRLVRRYSPLTAIVSLAPGVGVRWFDTVKRYGLSVESWAIHRDMGKCWSKPSKEKFNRIVKSSDAFGVNFPSSGELNPRMFYDHLRSLATAADIHVVIWDDQSEAIAGLVSRDKPTYMIDPQARRVQWYGAGYCA